MRMKGCFCYSGEGASAETETHEKRKRCWCELARLPPHVSRHDLIEFGSKSSSVEAHDRSMVGQRSANGWLSVGQWLANGWPMVCQLLANG